MADELLDAIMEVVKIALSGNQMLDEIALQKDTSNYCLVLKLKNWTKLAISEEVMTFESSPDFFYHDGLVENKPEIVETGEEERPVPAPLAAVKRENSEKNLGSENLAEGLDSPLILDLTSNLTENDLSRRSARLRKLPTKSMRESSPDSCSGVLQTSVDEEERDRNKKQRKEFKEERERKLAFLKCESCDYLAKDEFCLKQHSRIHQVERSYACSVCDFTAKKNYILSRHMRIHKNEQLYRCDLCDFQSSNKTSLKTHRLFRHTETNSFKCQYCDYSGKTENVLKNHKKRMHLQSVESFKCQDCTFETSDKRRWDEHVETHQQNYSFTCHICGKSYTTKSEFRDHMRLHSKPENQNK